jgi:ABC-type molybdate transport system substrate-binding protein
MRRNFIAFNLESIASPLRLPAMANQFQLMTRKKKIVLLTRFYVLITWFHALLRLDFARATFACHWIRTVFAVSMLVFSAVAVAQEVVVSAAASLNDAFKEIGRIFEVAKPGTKVVFNFGASGPLLEQVGQGAPVDVFASADQETMDRAVTRGLIATDNCQIKS